MATITDTATAAPPKRRRVGDAMAEKAADTVRMSTRRRWPRTLTLLALTAVAGGLSLKNTIANVVARTNPMLAGSLAPTDGRFQAAAAAATFAATLDKSASGPSARAAKSALLSDPTAVDAVVVLAMQAQLRGASDDANRLFNYALRLSRREFRPQLWAIENAVNQGKYRAALRSYDLAMRTSGYGQEVLFPIISNAMREKEIRAEVIRLMGKKPAWRDSLIHYIAVMPQTSLVALALIPELSQARIPVARTDALEVVRTLAAQQEYEAAWQLDRSLNGAKRRAGSRDPFFKGRSDDGSPFEWSISQETGSSVSIMPFGDKGAADFSVAPGSGGLILSQLTLAPPGKYRLFYSADRFEPGDRADVKWMVTCESGGQLSSLAFGPRPTQQGTNDFVISASCPVQRLQLWAQNLSQHTDLAGRITSAGFAPLRVRTQSGLRLR